MNYKQLNKTYLNNAYTHTYTFIVNYKGTMRICLINAITTRQLNEITHIDFHRGSYTTRINNTKKTAEYIIAHSDVCINTHLTLKQYKDNAKALGVAHGFYAEHLVAMALGGMVNPKKNISYNLGGDVILMNGTHIQVKAYNATVAVEKRDKRIAKARAKSNNI